MKVVTPKQMNEIDKLAAEEIGIPSIVLMENAALAVVQEVEKTFEILQDKKVIVFAGKGNNGGDAFVIARHLFNKGLKIVVCITSKKQTIKGDAAVNLNIIEKMGIEIIEILDATQLDNLKLMAASCDMIIDGIFGTGLKGEVLGINNKIIEIINDSCKNILSIDIPSGTCGLTGKVLGISVKAKKTVTFCLPKLGIVIQPGCDNAGEIVVADISIPKKLIESFNIKTNLIDVYGVSQLIPKRHSDSNKGDYGRAFFISGSVGMTGAGCLAAGAALRSGTGLVYLGVPEILTSIYDTALIEAITIPLEDNGRGALSKQALKQIMERIEKMSVVAIGPGLSTGNDIYEITSALIKNSKAPLIIDADALNVLAGRVDVLKGRSAEVIITPHPGEMSRLLGISIEDVQNNRIEVTSNFASSFGVIVVLKGARTVIASPDGNIFINPTGNSGMATAGTGDVLTGIIAGLIAQGARPLDAARVGVFLHGLAGDNRAKIKGEHGMIASDLVNELPHIIKKIGRLSL